MESGGIRIKDSDHIPSWCSSAIHLYNRCLLAQELELPCLGAVDDQPELIMQMFEIISDERNQFMNQQREKIERLTQSKTRKKSPGGIRKWFRR